MCQIVLASDCVSPDWDQIQETWPAEYLPEGEVNSTTAYIKYIIADQNLDLDHVTTAIGLAYPHMHYEYDFRDPNSDCSNYPNPTYCDPTDANYIPTWDEVRAHWDKKISESFAKTLDTEFVSKATINKDCCTHAIEQASAGNNANYNYIPWLDDSDAFIENDFFLISETKYIACTPPRPPCLSYPEDPAYPEPQQPAHPLDIISYSGHDHFAIVKEVDSNGIPTLLEWKYNGSPVYKTVPDPNFPWHAPFMVSQDLPSYPIALMNFKLYRKKPSCWLAPKQCYGDADNRKEGNPIIGYYYVGNYDLTVALAAMDKTLEELMDENGNYLEIEVGGMLVPLIAADFDHQADPNGIRVTQKDFDILEKYYKRPAVPSVCLCECQ